MKVRIAGHFLSSLLLGWCCIAFSREQNTDLIRKSHDLNWMKSLIHGTNISKDQRNGSTIWSMLDLEKLLILPHTDIGPTHRRIWIVTTASLPWMTGTSINPVLRAAALTRDRDVGMITLVLPFLPKLEDQKKVFSNGVIFHSHAQQEEAIREWLNNAGLISQARKLRFVFYNGRYDKAFGSILPAEDITALIPKNEADICILEEPEHLNWQRPPGHPWTSHFSHVIGIVHTNYLAYSSGFSLIAPILTVLLKWLNKLVARGYTNKLIKLSAVIQNLASEKEVVCNVHGVREIFLKAGDEYYSQDHSRGAYFIGKSLWAKGYRHLFELLNQTQRPKNLKMDLYGSGPDRAAIEKEAKRLGLPLTFYDGRDHAHLEEYSVFVNPSTSEVLCTTIAEALAMGKWVVCAKHSSNEFFYQFPNCLPFSTKEEFTANVAWALRHEPQPLSADLRNLFTWEAATDRLISCASLTIKDFEQRRQRIDWMCERFHRFATWKRKFFIC